MTPSLKLSTPALPVDTATGRHHAAGMIKMVATAILTAIPLMLSVSVFAENTQQTPLITTAKQFSTYEKNFDQARLAAFERDLEDQTDALKSAEQALAAQEARAKSLREQFSNNEEVLTEKTEALRLRTGSLGEMFGVVRQVAGDLRTVTSTGITRVDGTDTLADLDVLAESRALPDLSTIRNLWQTLRQEARLSAQLTRVNAPVIQPDGSTDTEEVVRLGAFSLIGTKGAGSEPRYLVADEQLGALREPARQPTSARQLPSYLSASTIAPVSVDPSRGALLNIEASAPSIAERIRQGGTIGYLIIALGGVGLAIAVWRLLALGRLSLGIRRQLSAPQSPTEDNPLGRVMLAARSAPVSSSEFAEGGLTEARLDEAVLRELPAIERGQSVIRLLAGIAPLMGLLGTVTGMIATFQAITAYGSGDAKLMAAGISQALITTVLGLIVAVPLLLLHSWVSSRSKELVQILDEQSAGIIAEIHEQGRSE